MYIITVEYKNYTLKYIGIKCRIDSQDSHTWYKVWNDLMYTRWHCSMVIWCLISKMNDEDEGTLNSLLHDTFWHLAFSQEPSIHKIFFHKVFRISKYFQPTLLLLFLWTAIQKLYNISLLCSAQKKGGRECIFSLQVFNIRSEQLKIK